MLSRLDTHEKSPEGLAAVPPYVQEYSNRVREHDRSKRLDGKHSELLLKFEKLLHI